MAPGEQPPAVIIELAPLAVAPEVPPQDAVPGPQMTEAQPEPTPEMVKTQTEDIKPDPTPPDPMTSPEPEIKVPELPKIEQAEALLAPLPPVPKPKVHKKPSPRKREVERKKPIEPARPKVRQTTAPPTSDARRPAPAAAPTAGASFQPSVSPASWKGELMEHLNRYKRFPPGANRGGTASIVFTVNRAGNVLSASLINLSGDSALDEEAVALVRRASPVPPRHQASVAAPSP